MIEKQIGDIAKGVVKGLSPRAEALLVFALAACAIAEIWLGVNPWLAFAFSIGVYLLYIWRAERDDQREIRMKELEITQLQLQNEVKLEQIKAKKLEQKKPEAGASPRNDTQASAKKNTVK